MNPGDVVKKTKGDYDYNKVGIVLAVQTNSLGNTIVRVLSDGKLKSWYSEYLEIINEAS